MCNKKDNCCCDKETNQAGCGKTIPHKANGTEKEFPCGKQRDNKDETCCCEDKDQSDE